LRRIASGLIVAFLFLGLFAFVFTVQPARALTGTYIIINPDGIITPSAAPINDVGNVTYTFTSDLVNDSIVIERNNIIMNGAAYTLQGNTALSVGMNLTGRSNVTIENMKITGFSYGVYLYSSSNCTVSGSNITNNRYDAGVYLNHSPNNTVSRNNITNNLDYGVYLEFSSNTTVSGDNITNNGYYGVYLASSPNNTVSGNTFTNNGLYVSQSLHNIAVNNSVNSKPLVYLEDNSGGNVSDAGQVVLVDCNSMTLDNLNISQAGIGVELWQTNNTRITNDNITNNWQGIYLDSCTNNTISGNNKLTNNVQMGVDFESCPKSTIAGNNITGSYYGVYLDSSPNSTVSGNNITNNEWGIYLSFSSNCTLSENEFMSDGLQVVWSFHNIVGNNFVNGKPLVYLEDISDLNVSDAGQVVLVSCTRMVVDNLNLSHTSVGVELWQTNNTRITNDSITHNYPAGVYLSFSSNCTVSGNNITSNDYGVFLTACPNSTVSGNSLTKNSWSIDLESSSASTFSGNSITNNYCGVELSYSFNNTFFHNNFNGNTHQVASSFSANVWDSGYPSGGNYWSDYQTRYPNASEIDSSGIWNLPYVIDANNTDHYPLMSQVAVPELQPFMLLPLFMTITLIGATVFKKRKSNNTFSG